ncbi:MAG: hypothetical protein E7334_10485 [Clostridiales bacterium]|nr:hypothetical protein [Clostridiales bacterium]
MLNEFFDTFNNPPRENTLIPFWFLNDTLKEEELIKQIEDFDAKGVHGFVLHPRIGMPKDQTYLSDEFMALMRACVKRANELSMYVVLYDEGSYPSGSASGQVVKNNPLHAARMLYPVKQSDYIRRPGEDIVDFFYVKFKDGQLIDYSKSPLEGFDKYLFVLGFTGGTIRGLHEDEDDGGANAPAAGDLLSFEAMRSFINLTHDKYYKWMGEYFGDTIIGFFTDEPSLTGRAVKNMNGGLPWTYGFEYPAPLPELFFANPKQEEAKNLYNAHLRERFKNSYYEQLSDWCREHGIDLMGHPGHAFDSDLQQYFGIPGQDVVWRWVAPEENLEKEESLTGKNGADIARQLCARRNSNEVLGVCGSKKNPWDMPASDIIWYFNWLCARGVNMLIPHAFYYSLRTPLQFSERPPDVGPGNIWWPHFNKIADYASRLCWLNTDSVNHPIAGVISTDTYMPIKAVKPLYENAIDFNYLYDRLLISHGRIENGKLISGTNAYDTVLIDENTNISPELSSLLYEFKKSGGRVYIGDDFMGYIENTPDIMLKDRFEAYPEDKNARLVHLTKDGIEIYLLFNENDPNENDISGRLRLGAYGQIYEMDPMSGDVFPIFALNGSPEKGMELDVIIPPYSVRIFAVDKNDAPSFGLNPHPIWQGDSMIDLTCDTENTFGAAEPITYEGSCEINTDFINGAQYAYILHIADLLEQCDIWINGKNAGTMLIKPHQMDVTEFIKQGSNTFTLTVTPSKANTYGTPKDAGLSEAWVETLRIR